MNQYDREILKGQHASRLDSTFDPELGTCGGHICCGSKAWWRHKQHCKNVLANLADDLSDLNDI